jgi:hypothetical protein
LDTLALRVLTAGNLQDFPTPLYVSCFNPIFPL